MRGPTHLPACTKPGDFIGVLDALSAEDGAFIEVAEELVAVR